MTSLNTVQSQVSLIEVTFPDKSCPGKISNSVELRSIYVFHSDAEPAAPLLGGWRLWGCWVIRAFKDSTISLIRDFNLKMEL